MRVFEYFSTGKQSLVVVLFAVEVHVEILRESLVVGLCQN
jgi:hypothetical protein